jgi:hypothetical protein
MSDEAETFTEADEEELAWFAIENWDLEELIAAARYHRREINRLALVAARRVPCSRHDAPIGRTCTPDVQACSWRLLIAENELS